MRAFSGTQKKQEGVIVIGGKQEDPLWMYEVNLLFDQSEEHNDGPCPMVEENNPTYINLFGGVRIPFRSWRHMERRL